MIPLPYPQFIVFYNGTDAEPERQILELQDAFPKWCKKENAALACRAVVLNINLGYNADILEKCKRLKEYAQFIAKIREFLELQCTIAFAVEQAMDACIKEGILEEILRNHREEVRSMLLTEYDEQAHIKNEREIAYEDGREEGIKEGIKEGEARLSKLLQCLENTGRNEDIKKVIYDLQYREILYKEFAI